MIISLDCETTGVDFAHGAAPFLVTTCDGDGLVQYWEWDVDPLTRRPDVPTEDAADIAELLDAADVIYLHNAKFDARALAAIGVELPWPKVRDTLIASHLLATNHPHDLTWLCVEYLGVDIEPFELRVKEATQKCRAVVRRDHPTWRIADEGVEGMPSVKAGSKRDEDKPWKNDMWLPRALARVDIDAVPNGALTACAEYANMDSVRTLELGLELERLIRERGYWEIYRAHRTHLPRAACEMECRGVTVIGEYTAATIRDYERHVAEAEEALKDIAWGYGHELELAQGASINDNMRDFFYGAQWDECPRCGHRKRVKHWNGEGQAHWLDTPTCPKCGKGNSRRRAVRQELVRHHRENLGLKVIERMHGGQRKAVGAALDKEAMAEYLTTTEGPANEFVRLLADKRKRDTDLTYMRAYCRFWVPVPGAPGYYRIHPSLNPCGTDHLRWSSNSPNLQNVSVQEEACRECEGEGCALCDGTGKSRLSVRACFGPAPGREWWDFDFRNLEKRIPVYECMEPSLVEVFEKPDEPPYWGSDHNVLASLLFPDEYFEPVCPKCLDVGTRCAGGCLPKVPLSEVKDGFKKKHLIKYKRVKNTNFAKQYGAGRRKVDATAGVVGAFDKIERGLPKIAELQAHYLAVAQRVGFVQTLPDRTVDPERGYPVLASRTEDGRVLSTTPFNYHVSGTACWVKNTALVRCADQCARWRAEGFDAWVCLEVHDSILFDLPRGATPRENLPRALVLKGLMERSGADLVPAIPTPVSMSYHTRSWAEEVPL